MDLCYYRKTKTKALGITCSTLVRNNTSSGTYLFTGIFFFNMLDSNNPIWFMTICIIYCKTCYLAEESQLDLACLRPHAYTHPFWSSAFHAQELCHLVPPTPSTIRVIFFHLHIQAEWANLDHFLSKQLFMSQKRKWLMAYPQKSLSLIPVLVIKLNSHL